MAYAHVLERHAEEAAELWALRSARAYAPHYDRPALDALDERVEANLDGVARAGEDGAKAAAALPLHHAGSAFVRTAAALSARDPKRLAAVLDAVGRDKSLEPGVRGALAWLPLSTSRWAVDAMTGARSPTTLKRLGLEALVAHRECPNGALVDAMGSASAPLVATAMESAALLGRRELVKEVVSMLDAPAERVKRAAAWSAALLGVEGAGERLWSSGLEDSARGRAELVVAIGRSAPSTVAARIGALLDTPDQRRLGAVAAGIAGLGDWIARLCDLLPEPRHQRIATEALCRITGCPVDPAIRRPPPEGADPGPNDDPSDDRVALDPDARLPWVDPDAMAARARARAPGGGFRALWGRPLGLETLQSALANGSQRLRHECAIEWVMREPGPVEDVARPAVRRAPA